MAMKLCGGCHKQQFGINCDVMPSPLDIAEGISTFF